MKPLSEKLKEIPLAHCTTKLLLQAWLREANLFVNCFDEEEGEFISMREVREELLGTTRTEGKNG